MKDKKFFKPMQVREPEKCEICGKMDELRPYGENGEWLCFECGEKNPEITKKMMNRAIDMIFATQQQKISENISIINCT